MARRVIGYTGTGRARQPIYDDGDGGASGKVSIARGGFGQAQRLGELSIPNRELGSELGDRAPIERRQATDAERAAWEARDAAGKRPKIRVAPEGYTPAHVHRRPSPPAREKRPATSRQGRARPHRLGEDPATREARLLAAVRGSTSLRAASAALNLSPARVGQIVHEMRREGRLPRDIDLELRRRGRGRPRVVR